MMYTTRRYRVFRFTLLTTIIALILQYVLGMFVNLYTQFPDTLPGGNAFAWSFTNSMIIQFHIYLGTLLLILPLIALGLSIGLKQRGSILVSVLGFFLILFTYTSGMLFLSNVQEDAPSLWMAIGMMGALAVYGYEYYLTRPTASQETRPAHV